MDTTQPASFSGEPTGTRVLYGEIVSDGRRVPDAAVVFDEGGILFSGPREQVLSEARSAGLTPQPLNGPLDGAILLPGLIDLHNHGGFGHDFPNGSRTDLAETLREMHAHGTTRLLASTVTQEREELLAALARLADLADAGLIEGIHAEGPFVSPAHRGAQNPTYIREPDLELTRDMIDAARGHLVSMTLAPELAGSEELIELLANSGVIPSIGHTGATFEQAAGAARTARKALARAAGATGLASAPLKPTFTHLFNGMEPMHHRKPGTVTAALAAARNADAVVEIIGDGTHVDPAMVATMFTLLGPENIALVSDSMAAAGLGDGEYSLGGLSVEVADGAARLTSDGSLAGGTALCLDVVRRVRDAGVPLESAVVSASATPANVLGRSAELGTLRPGARADILVTDANLNLTHVVRDSKLLNRTS